MHKEVFGNPTLTMKVKKNAVGLKPKQVAEILLSEYVENHIVLIEEGRTDEGFEFNTVRIYSRRKK